MVAPEQCGTVVGTITAPKSNTKLSGTAFFRPTAKVILLGDNAEQVFGATVKANIADGVLEPVLLLGTDNPNMQPAGFTWEVTFDVTYEGRTVQRPGFSFALPAGETLNLGKAAPLPPSPGTVVVVNLATAERALIAAERAETAAQVAQDIVDGYVPPEGGTGSGTVDTVARTAAQNAQSTADDAARVAASKYELPATGFPLTGLSTSVRDSLARADSALQSAPVTSVANKTGVVSLTKDDVGLSNVTNVAPADLPVSSATSSALAGKAATSHTHTASQLSDATTTGRSILTAADAAAARATLGAGTASTKADVGLGNVTNVAPADLPVSTATQSALAGKANTSHTHTVSQLSDASTVGKALAVAADAATARGAIGAGTASTKADVGLGNVSNLAPADLPVSSATQTALDAKAATSHTHTASQVSDATTIGRNVLTAASQAAGRTALGITGTGADGGVGATGPQGAAGGATLLPAGATSTPLTTPIGTLVGYRK